MTTIVLGAQLGALGKAKLIDALAPKSRLIARAAGGYIGEHSSSKESNGFNLLPSGLISPQALFLIGSAVLFHVPTFIKDLEELPKKYLQAAQERILVSERVSIHLDLHTAVDALEDAELASTRSGTAATRSAIKLSDVFDPQLFETTLRRLAGGYKKRFGDLLQYDVEDEIKRFEEYRVQLAQYVVDDISLFKQVQDSDAPILIEGANYGTYPYVTSSATGLGGVFTGLPLNPTKIKEIVGVLKAYTTTVTEGPFVTEETGDIGSKLQESNGEVPPADDRKRRFGWLDLVVVKHNSDINHYNALILNKIHALDSFLTIKVAIGYKDKETGEELPSFPASATQLERVEVIYHELPGWNKSTKGARSFYDLPKEARAFISYIENFTKVKVRWIGTGPERDAIIFRG